VAGFAVLSLCCGAGLLTPAAEFVDLRLDSPRPGMVLPLPDGLTLLSAERDCGSEQCIEVYLISSPDAADSAEVEDRLWTHLVEAKGWQRRRDDAGCVRYGWLLRHGFCGFASSDPDQRGGVLRFLVSGAVAVSPTALPGVSGGAGTVAPW
jgi:hypothetical protein